MNRERNPMTEVSRRSFIKIGSMSIAVLMAHPFTNFVAKANDRTIKKLVILEMNGGNDGLNTVIPYADPAYYDKNIRGPLAIAESKVFKLTEPNGTESGWGLHPSLVNLKSNYDGNRVAIFRGIGHRQPDLSHFTMMDFWRSGHPGGAAFTNGTGWAARAIERISNSTEPIAAISLSTGVSPLFLGTDRAASATSPAAGQLDLPEAMREAYLQAMLTLATQETPTYEALTAARKGLKGGVDFSHYLAELVEIAPAYPETATGALLAFAASIIKSNDWVRIIHVPLPLEHDTHAYQLPLQEANLKEMDEALAAFLVDIGARSELYDNVAVMTTSEFGRRVIPNGDAGTDHGTANTHFFIGDRVKGGLYGDPPSLTDLYEGDLRATSVFTRWLATGIRWLALNPREVLADLEREEDSKPYDLFT